MYYRSVFYSNITFLEWSEKIFKIKPLNKNDFYELSEAYKKNGFTIIEDFLSQKSISKIKEAIQLVKNKQVDLYEDRSGNLRRMENFTFKHETFKIVNKIIMKILLQITSFEQTLFKDKVNFKPSNGEGFYPHFDGIFQFKTKNGELKNGWYEYASEFNNCLICLDSFTLENGTLEISKSHNEDFKTLLNKTKCDGTPDIKDDLLNHLEFQPILANAGSVVFFKHTCPHKSSPNYSKNDRGSLYLSYNNLKDGTFYDQYFSDKKGSINKNKSLKGDQI